VIADADGEGRRKIEREEQDEVNGARGEPQAEESAGVETDDEETLNPLNPRQHGERLFERESARVFFEQKNFSLTYVEHCR
jgi:hypothetical protein